MVCDAMLSTSTEKNVGFLARNYRKYVQRREHFYSSSGHTRISRHRQPVAFVFSTACEARSLPFAEKRTQRQRIGAGFAWPALVCSYAAASVRMWVNGQLVTASPSPQIQIPTGGMRSHWLDCRDTSFHAGGRNTIMRTMTPRLEPIALIQRWPLGRERRTCANDTSLNWQVLSHAREDVKIMECSTYCGISIHPWM